MKQISPKIIYLNQLLKRKHLINKRGLLNYKPYVITCPTYHLPYVLSCLTGLVSCVVLCLIYPVVYVLSCLTCHMLPECSLIAAYCALRSPVSNGKERTGPLLPTQ